MLRRIRLQQRPVPPRAGCATRTRVPGQISVGVNIVRRSDDPFRMAGRSSCHTRGVSPPALIELRGVALHYSTGAQRIEVLRGVDLDIAAGQTVAVTGPSGTGKTSLLLLLAGLERPAAGTVALDGRRLDTLDRDALADLRRDHIGIVFQSFHLLPSLTALDNVALPMQIAGRRDALALARERLAEVGLAHRMDHHPSQLSGGEQQRVAIARALVHRPALLLADEPTGNLDDHTGEQVRELLFALHRASGTTLVLVTHDLGFAGRCQRVLQLHEGRLHEGRVRDGRFEPPADVAGAPAETALALALPA
jgi:putative ABC transport system ATP-binding protein